MQPFILELGSILEQRALSEILGICSLKENCTNRPATIDFTSGRANLTLPFDIVPHDGNTIDAMWQFGHDPSSACINTGVTGQGKGGMNNGHNHHTTNMLTLEIDKPSTVFGQCKIRYKGKPHLKRRLTRI